MPLSFPTAVLSEEPLVADAGCSSRRVHRHFADVQDDVLTGRFGFRSSESGRSQVGHKLPLATGRFAATKRARCSHRIQASIDQEGHHGVCRLTLRTAAVWQVTSLVLEHKARCGHLDRLPSCPLGSMQPCLMSKEDLSSSTVASRGIGEVGTRSTRVPCEMHRSRRVAVSGERSRQAVGSQTARIWTSCVEFSGLAMRLLSNMRCRAAARPMETSKPRLLLHR
jgi:hypothetical protein